MPSLSQAVKQTLLYARFFNFPLTLEETHFWLISPKTYPLDRIKKYYQDQHPKQNRLIRNRLEQITAPKIALAFQVAKFIRLIPTVRLIALSGSVAIGNPELDDDLDFLIITSPDTLWLTRLILIPFISLFFSRRQPHTFSPSPYHNHNHNTICLNLWLDESALIIPASKQNLYIAHEVLQVKPIFDRGETYRQFILANSWTKKYLATAHENIISRTTTSSFINVQCVAKRSPAKRDAMCNLKCKIINALNRFAYKIQRLYMRSRITTEVVTLHSAFFHPRDLSSTIDNFLLQKR